jgi:hypothetical protein
MKKLIINSLLICATVFVIGGCTKTPGDIYISEQTKAAHANNRWAQFKLWDAYYNGTHAVDKNQGKADQWLKEFVKGVYLVRFEAASGFQPKTPMDYLNDISKYTPQVQSANDGVGLGSFFRTTKNGDKLAASFLTEQPEKLQSYIESNPDLKFISAEAMTPQAFIEYEQSPQESLMSSETVNSDTIPAVALESGQAFLALLDGGNYSKAWEGVAATMQSTMSQSDFEKGMLSIRTPLGKLVARELKGQKHKTHLPGLPDGDYWVVAYTTTFENKPNVVETLVLGLGQDGGWKVAGYSLP